MFPLEKSLSNIYHVFGLDRIKSRVLFFTLLAILIPSLTMGWQSFRLNKQFITAKISEELKSATSHTVREFNLWLKERFYEMRVFSSSYEITENVEKITQSRGSKASEAQAHGRLTDYLRSVKGKFLDYEELMVMDQAGKLLATSSDIKGALSFQPDWLKQARTQDQIVGETYLDKALGKGVQVIAVPIKSPTGGFLGILAGKLNFRTVEKILKGVSLGETTRAYLVRQDGTVIVSSRPTGSPFLGTRFPEKTTDALFQSEQSAKDQDQDLKALEYRDAQGTAVLGTLMPVAQLNWGAVTEIEQREAYAKSNQVVNQTLLILLGLVVVIGLAAYFLGLTIVRPLERLTDGASKVAGGNLGVKVPVVGHGEVVYLTQVFNDMVGHLSQKTRELQELSITDGLTGLYNRKHLMEALTNEINRAKRFKHPFSILMIDIDHFKQYNDTYGHLAGDRLLGQVGALFRSTIRNIDFAARYGGEEFLLMLPEVGLEGGAKLAEVIRSSVASEMFQVDGQRTPITVSIGVAVFPEHGKTPEVLVETADLALYQAKRLGRNQVVLASQAVRKATRT